ncbi:amidohydrolase family protein [Nocardioides sp. KC13]|uniref:Amidohydrolase family protein n=1 Tax=Nocardioides turkmenicus TaxID=2711220 RepID=A0A6M1R750_9ACTN|nr:amidohydrolase family protein [Nocardioides sp. KC13]NGN95442.1 amidohydrolase family protein [Nocardioides sp. KC13]
MFAIRATHAFDGVRFLTDGATVIVDGDRIAGVEGARFEVPEGVEVTTCDGTILPGLFDCHTHLVADSTFGGLEQAGCMDDAAVDEVIAGSLRQHAAAGVTTVRDLGDRSYRTLAFRDRPGLPRVLAAGPPITTVGGHCHFLGGAVSGDVRDAVRERAERGVDVIKVMASGGFATPGTDTLGAQFTVEELRAIVEEAARLGLRVVAHAHSLAGIRNALTAGVSGIEHFTGLTAEGPRLDDDLLEEVASRGVVVDMTMGSVRSAHAQMPPPPPEIATLMASLGWTSIEDFYVSRFAVLARLRGHGVRLIAGVDSGMGPFKPHGSAWRTVGEFVEGGYPIEEALAAATATAAEACGLGAVTGRLSPGYAADLLVVDGDVATDPTVLGKPLAVLVRGTPVPQPGSVDSGVGEPAPG